MTDSFQTDVAIIGGGIVGLATAWRLQQRHPDRRVTVLEKESGAAAHQSGHNSGVLHSGIYYRPGSLRATNCRAGKLAMQEFCQEYGIPFDICGKVIVAVDEPEIPRLERIFERGQANGVDCRMIDANRLHELEPHVAGVMAIQVPEAGIVDYTQVCEKLAELIRQQGGTIRFDSRVDGVQIRNGGVRLETRTGDVEAKHLVTCAGLQADRVARMTGHPLEANIVPFRGEYFELQPHARHLCRNLIYPVPDPSFPFLGVHFTRMIHGGVECGPNAVLAFAREGYTRTDINLRDLVGTLTYPGFLRLAAKYWRTGAGEMWRSISKAAFVRALQRLIPAIRSEDLVAAPAGVRAQALGRHGEGLDDFVIEESERVINVGNAPSPAATASLNIGNLIVDRLELRFR
ncbi:MAG: L-2-hydroxyglutarate oxidase [Maioricimonas sp. JB049]